MVWDMGRTDEGGNKDGWIGDTMLERGQDQSGKVKAKSVLSLFFHAVIEFSKVCY